MSEIVQTVLDDSFKWTERENTSFARDSGQKMHTVFSPYSVCSLLKILKTVSTFFCFNTLHSYHPWYI